MQNKIPVSVVVPVLNEEKNLAQCLAALADFQEVIVVDSGSTDSTLEIARRFNVRLLNFEWNGVFPKKRNWVLLTQEIAASWVLFLDADETVTPQFCNELRNTLLETDHNGFWLSYNNHFLGRRLKYGIPQRKLALMRTGSGLYEKIDEASWSQLDMEIHEHLIINGSVGEISSPINHDDDRGIMKFVDRHKEYAIWETQRAKRIDIQRIDQNTELTNRQKFKYKNLSKWWYGSFYFVVQLLYKRGILDGYQGIQYALLKFWYFNLIYVLLREEKAEATKRLGK